MNCIKCKEAEIAVKKYKLCSKCYGDAYRNGKLNRYYKMDLCDASVAKHEHASEINFIKNYFKHQNWILHPVCFKLNNLSYTPDFYDGVRNCFIEVAGTRQAYHANKHKYELMREIYPLINFEIRKIDGSLIDTSEDQRVSWDVAISNLYVM